MIAPPHGDLDLLRRAEELLSARLPAPWQLELHPEPGFERLRPDATLHIEAPDGKTTELLVEAKTTLNTRDVPAVLAQLDAIAANAPSPRELGPPLVISRYLAPRTRESLAAAGASYVDATGNIRIALSRPGLYVEGIGASSDPWRGPERATRTLRGKPAAKVVRALVDFKSPIGVRDLAKQSGASLGSTYRAVAFLEKEALLTRGARGNIESVDWQDLLLRWSEDYSFEGSNRIRPVFEPRGIERVREKLKRLGGKVPYVVTGALSAGLVSEVAAVKVAAIYTPEVERLEEVLELRDSTGASNVLLAQPFDDVLLARPRVVDGVAYAAFSQTFVDLMTSPGRGPAEAQSLMSWMAANEEAWRG
jgi:hypothetical protein